MLEKYPKMAKVGYKHPGVSRDPLFDADYQDSPGQSCEDCIEKKDLDKQDREEQLPIVHVGTIASGIKVVADASFRDKVGEEHHAICIEMEAAGIMNSFPCVVIRGISDYSDSQKNDRWQKYAAAVAAGCAKELLTFVQSSSVDQERAAKDLLHQSLSHTQ